MILATTIQNKLKQVCGAKKIAYEFDIRYLQKWVELYPNCFPVFIRENKYTILFNETKLRYEFHKQ